MKKKTLINRICTLLCALVVAVGMFGGVVCVRADDSETTSNESNLCAFLNRVGLYELFRDKINFTEKDGYNYIVATTYNESSNRYNIYLLESTNSRFYLDSKERLAFEEIEENDIYYYRAQFLFSDNTCSWQQRLNWSGVSYLAPSDVPSTYDMLMFYTDVPIYLEDSGVVCIEAGTNWFNTTFTNIDYTNKTFETIDDSGSLDDEFDNIYIYDATIGYLQNLTQKTLFKYGENYTVDVETAVNRISFDSKTTTGLDLTSDNYTIRVYEQFAVYKRSSPNVNVYPNMPKILVGEYPAKNLKFDYIVQDALNYTTAETGDVDGYNAFTTIINGYIRSDNMYYQIYDNSTGACGGYVMIRGDGSESVVSGEFATTIMPDGTVDDTGYIERPVDTSTGTGLNYDDAEHDANEAVPDGTVSDAMGALEGNLNEFVASVKVIPNVISSIFSFLPSWCLNLFAVSIGLGCVIFLWKLLRG